MKTFNFRRAIAALGPLLRAKRRPMPAGPATVAFAPPGVPVASSPAKPARTARKRPPVAPVAASPPRTVPCGLTKLQCRLNDLLAEDIALSDACYDANERINEVKAARGRLPKRDRAGLQAEFDAASAEVTRLSGLCLIMETRLKAARLAIKMAK